MNFLRYLFGEVKSGRLQKAEALRVLAEFEQGCARHCSRHPLLRAEASTFTLQSFAVALGGTEFFLAGEGQGGGGHVPGGVHLELVRAAALESFERVPGKARRVEVREALWSEPVRLGEGGVSLSVRLWRVGEREARYEIVRLGRTTEEV